MTTDAPTPADLIRQKLKDAPAPLKLADLAAKKLQPDALAILREGVEQGWAFVAKSGAKEAERYWSRDESQAIRDAVLEAATEPKSLTVLKKAAKDAFKSDAKFAASTVDGMVAAGQLHAHEKGKAFGKTAPPLIDDPVKVTAALVRAAATPQPLAALLKAVVAETKAGKAFVEGIAKGLIDTQLHAHAPAKGKTPLYGTEKPRVIPRLERKENAKAFSTLVAAATKLLTTAGVTADELIQTLRAKLTDAPPADDYKLTPGAEKLATGTSSTPVSEPPAPASPHMSLEDSILSAIDAAPVVSLADLRMSQRAEYQGKVFDEVVLRLADEERIVLYQDANPVRFSEAERAQLVQDGESVFTTISKRG